MRYIDTHVHLTDGRYDSDREAVLERAAQAGVVACVSIATTLDDALTARKLAETHAPEAGGRLPKLFTTAGYHPHQAQEYAPAREDELRAMLLQPGVVAAGEMGLDYHYDFAPRDVQRRVFERQIAIAIEVDRPIVVHCRESFADIHDILKAHVGAGLRGVLHCFSEGPAEAEAILALGGFVLGFGGVATLPRSQSVRDAARVAGLDHSVLETDGPYLAPLPRRGRRNEPGWLVYTAETLSTTLGVEQEEVARKTTATALRLYGLTDLDLQP